MKKRWLLLTAASWPRGFSCCQLPAPPSSGGRHREGRGGPAGEPWGGSRGFHGDVPVSSGGRAGGPDPGRQENSQSAPHTSLVSEIVCLVSSLENAALYMYSPLYYTTAPLLAINTSGCNSAIKDKVFCSPLDVDIPIRMTISSYPVLARGTGSSDLWRITGAHNRNVLIA